MASIVKSVQSEQSSYRYEINQIEPVIGTGYWTGLQAVYRNRSVYTNRDRFDPTFFTADLHHFFRPTSSGRPPPSFSTTSSRLRSPFSSSSEVLLHRESPPSRIPLLLLRQPSSPPPLQFTTVTLRRRESSSTSASSVLHQAPLPSRFSHTMLFSSDSISATATLLHPPPSIATPPSSDSSIADLLSPPPASLSRRLLLIRSFTTAIHLSSVLPSRRESRRKSHERERSVSGSMTRNSDPDPIAGSDDPRP